MGRRLLLYVLAWLGALSLPAAALDLEVKLLAKGSAILTIDGEQYRLKVGERSPEGVLLVSSDTRKALVEYEGERQTLTLSRRISSRFEPSERTQVRISPSRGGHYVTRGSINGRSVQMMVDTGATSVAINRRTAERLGLDYRRGEPTQVSTANGVTTAYKVFLNRIAVGGLELQQVEALVTLSDFPEVVLLGNSYLSAVEMRVDQGVLLLEAKY